MLTQLRRAALAAPDAEAVRAGPDRLSRAELYDLSAAAAAATRRLAGRGPVAVLADGTADSIATVLGVIGSGADALLLEAGTSALTDPASPAHSAGPVMIVGPPESPARAGALAAGGAAYTSYARFRAPHDGSATSAAPGGEVLQLTSGSTGTARITRQPYANVVVGGQLYRDIFAIEPADVMLIAVPVVHSYGLAGLCSAVLAGANVVTLPRFGLRPLVDGLHGDVTMLLGTPLLYGLVAPVLRTRGPARLRIALSAGGPLPPTGAEDLPALLGTPVRQIFGTTEAGLIACVPQSAREWPAGSVGYAAPGVRTRLDPHTGHLQVRTPMMYRGYLGDDRSPLTPDGWYDTGDLVRIAADGHMFVLGRKESVVNVGGRKVGPQRVERVLLEHPAVREASVYGVQRADHEQEMHAAVAVEPGTEAGDLLAFCRARGLAPYEVPHRMHLLSTLPRNGMGKVDRQALLAATGHTGRDTASTTRPTGSETR